MQVDTAFTDDWAQLLSLLPADLESSARRTGALQRRRQVRDAPTLLRLALAYGYCDLSLRATAAWAEQAGVAQLSDVALLKRLRHSADWLAELVSDKLALRRLGLPQRRLRILLVDASVVSQPGSQGSDWRLHLGLDLASLGIDQVLLTSAQVAESLAHFPLAPATLVIADRRYAQRRQVVLAQQAQADCLIRLTWHNLVLLGADGQPLDIPACLQALAPDQVLDLPVSTSAEPQAGWPAIPGRFIAVAKPPPAAAAARKRLRRIASKKGQQLDPRSLICAGYFFVFTTLPAAQWPAAEVLALFRLRWQVELAFKRLKSLLALDALRAQDECLCRSYLLAKLLAALLLEDLLSQSGAAFSPWGAGCPAAVVAVAPVADAGRVVAPGHHPLADAGRLAARPGGSQSLPRLTPAPAQPSRPGA